MSKPDYVRAREVAKGLFPDQFSDNQRDSFILEALMAAYDEGANETKYHPVAFDEMCERFMTEMRDNSKKLEQLEKVISPLLARAHCECSDEEAMTLLRRATEEAEKIVNDDFGGMESMKENFQIWLDHQREKEQI
jgi:hypothetical protein